MFSLDIGFNDIIKIHQDSFRGLYSLRILNLEQNNLNSIPENLFQGLGLHVLILRHNDLHTLQPYVFQGLANLTELDLSNTNLRSLHPNLFSDLHNLRVLELDKNELHELHNGTFSGLQYLTKLRLNHNQFQTLPFTLLYDTINLNELYLNDNKLTALHQFIFTRLRNLHVLGLWSNEIRELPVGIFSEVPKLEGLYLENNNLVTLHRNTFSKLSNLHKLFLYSNSLHGLPYGLFSGLHSISMLQLTDNSVSPLHPNIFDGLRSLEILYLVSNKLQELSHNLFSDLSNLLELRLEYNELTILPRDILQDLPHLNLLTLDYNKLTALDPNWFKNLVNLWVLDLEGNELLELHDAFLTHSGSLWNLSIEKNKLKHLNQVVFERLVNLRILFLAYNKLTQLHPTIFQNCLNLTFVDLSFNELKDIPMLNYLLHLNYLNLRNNSLIAITHKTFSGLNKDVEILVGQHEICLCYTSQDVSCSASYNRSPYLTCKRLLSDRVLVIMMWFIGLNAIVGNLFVLVWRKENTKNTKFQDMLLTNLALSDFLMGVYMVILASADIYFGDNFPIQADSWRSGITCRIAGALSIISSEGSVFFVTLISIDRFIGIKYPMSKRKVGKKLAVTVIVATWFISLTVGVVPSVLSAGENTFKLYDIPNVCIGLPLALTESYTTTEFNTYQFVPGSTYYIFKKPVFSTKYEGLIKGMYFSTALFLGLNFVCYLTIMVCYILIVIEVRKSSNKSGRSVEMVEQVKLTTKVTVIVATDFLCWFPIIVLGILVQSNIITLPNVVYAWAVTVVLPINSAINPYLYTIADAFSKYRKRKNKKNKSHLPSSKTTTA